MKIERSTRLLSGHVSRLVSLWRGGGSSSPLTSKELKRAGEALLSLQRGLTGSRKLAGAGYMDDQVLLGSYLLYYWPVSYLQVSLLLSWRSDLLFREGEVDVLDLGCGPGAASSALIDLLPKGVHVRLTLADSSGKAMKLAEKLLSSPRVDVQRVRLDLMQEGALDALEGPYDFVLMNHTLNELWKDKEDADDRRALLIDQGLRSRIKQGGFLFIGEPALLLTSRGEMDVRDKLIERGWRVLGPCMATHPCPCLAAGPSHTCHAEVAWNPTEPMASLARIAGLDRTSVKMTGFLLSPEALEQERKTDEITALVVSEAMTNKSGRVRYLICDGKERVPFSAQGGDPAARRAGFFDLKRYDKVILRGVERRGDGFGWKAGTEMRVG